MDRRFNLWPVPSADCRTFMLRVPPSRIGLVCSLIEGHEGVAIVRTADRQAGLIDLWVMPGQETVVNAILAELETQFRILRIREVPGHPGLGEPVPREADHGDGPIDNA